MISERWAWFDRLWQSVCALRTRYGLPVRSRWWQSELQVEALAPVAALSTAEPRRVFTVVRSAVAEDSDSLICRVRGTLHGDLLGGLQGLMPRGIYQRSESSDASGDNFVS